MQIAIKGGRVRAAATVTPAPFSICSTRPWAPLTCSHAVYTQSKRKHLAGSSPLSMECNAWSPVDPVAQRISALARGNLLRPACRHTDGQKHHQFRLGLALGTIELSRLDRPVTARSAQENISVNPWLPVGYDIMPTRRGPKSLEWKFWRIPRVSPRRVSFHEEPQA